MKKDKKHNLFVFLIELFLGIISIMIGTLVLGVSYNNMTAIILGISGICVFTVLSIFLYFAKSSKTSKKTKITKKND